MLINFNQLLICRLAFTNSKIANHVGIESERIAFEYPPTLYSSFTKRLEYFCNATLFLFHIRKLAKSILGIWQVDVVKLASVRTIVLCSSSSIRIDGGRRYSRIPLKSKKRVHIRVHKRTSRVHKRVRKSTTEIHPQTAIMPNLACRGLAKSHERFIAWGIELP